MSQKINFTKAALDELTEQKKRYQVSDTKVPNLCLAVFPSGIKTFVLYRKVKGQAQRIKIGRYSVLTVEQARKQATKLNSLITLGGDPMSETRKQRSEITFRDLYEIYYQDHALPHTKRPGDNKKMLEYHIFPVIGKLKIGDITPEKIRKIHLDIGLNRGKVGANRVLRAVNAVFNFAIRQGIYRLPNPCFGLQTFQETARDRFLSKEELKKFFLALDKEDVVFRDFFSLLLYTGVRKSNLLSMRWDDIDFDLKRWRISERETKNKHVNAVFLSEHSLKILLRRKKANTCLEPSSKFVFPANSADGHLIDPSRAFQRIKDYMDVQDIRMHDLRRTLGSYMAINGASLLVIGSALNHRNQRSTAIYARLSQQPVAEAIQRATRSMINEKVFS